MIYEIMNQINNHFIKSVESGAYTIVSDGIEGSFGKTYLAGMYVMIQDSYLNDGAYKITGVASGKLTVADTLQAESTSDSILLYACSPPKAFTDLATDIEAFTETGLGVASESIDDYSVSYAQGTDGSGDGSWQSAYKNKLVQYRRVYDDRNVILNRSNYNIDTKSRW